MSNELNPMLSLFTDTTHQCPRLSPQRELDLCSRWQNERDERAKDEIMRSTAGYVVMMALKYRGYGLPLSQLIAEGQLGIVQALTQFEPGRAKRFATYAAYWIRAYILSYIIRSWSTKGSGARPLRSRQIFKLRRERARICNLLN
jgi:RNA polymerase sigma-32 factor